MHHLHGHKPASLLQRRTHSRAGSRTQVSQLQAIPLAPKPAAGGAWPSCCSQFPASPRAELSLGVGAAAAFYPRHCTCPSCTDTAHVPVYTRSCPCARMGQ